MSAATAPTAARAAAPGRLRARRFAGRAGQYLGLLCYLVFLAFPLVWLVSTSFKSPQELGRIDPTWIPQHPTLQNFRDAFEAQPLARSALNSLTVAGGATLISVAIAVPAAYVMVRYRSKVSSAATGWILVSQMFPFVLVIIPLFLVLKNIHLINSLGGLIIVYVVWNLPFSLWMLQGYVKAVPVSLEEAAAMDGAGRFRILRSVVLPLLAPGLVATLMFSFVTAWNEFFFALVLLKSPENQTMSVILTRFLGAEGVADLGPLAAASVLATIPSLLFFALLQRRLASGMLAGAVKG
ncbi:MULTISPECIES: carbohydrate ABC transporter permease [unclassified Streptomyces]|uniref:carbohydrate ABC transporter permease n=1 Tax=unclassified Streptomyces TaxID=2593676 RepID=UPI002DDC09BC|nr:MULTISPECIES: carbohydrate ABC transporter permease [unclassified Streptomyces]WSA95399.1 carbohydrate ABC transporter permease [Streptomyces sp. NBC_01795]WSB79816.1 carbohydrate ABC transporter permease [Streptomyces sp. NBC_01775]WSS11977.1 carbohydrate ABC transporter permease [Streptomyces sp. NBC_01186]WSS40691.1 carbohydrate ABC transporter permease [Streptomyces sp. NBC_01187]